MKFEIDPSKKHKLTPEAQARLDQASLDYSDIPELSNDWFESAALNVPTKAPINIRLDSDVLHFFKAFGKGYQTRINAILRAYVNTHKQS